MHHTFKCSATTRLRNVSVPGVPLAGNCVVFSILFYIRKRCLENVL